MKNLRLLLGVLGISLGLFACKSEPTTSDRFRKMAAEDSFKNMHEEPLDASARPGKGKDIRFPVSGGPEGRGYLIRATDTTSRKYLLVFQEWWGLNDHIKLEAEKYAAALPGVNVLALDFYDGKVATKREEAQAMVQAVDDDRVTALMKGAIAYTGPQAQIGTLGWCVGGMWSLQTAIEAGLQSTACVMYYGTPEDNPVRLSKLQAPVLGIFASQDKGITPADVDKFEKAMKTAGKVLIRKTYDAGHAFGNPSNPTYDKAATEDARKLTIGFLNENLVVKGPNMLAREPVKR